jgi:hypothetical protein
MSVSLTHWKGKPLAQLNGVEMQEALHAMMSRKPQSTPTKLKPRKPKKGK